MSLHTANFDKLANEWWDENGPMKPLHQMNPVRLGFIREHVEKNLLPPCGGAAECNEAEGGIVTESENSPPSVTLRVTAPPQGGSRFSALSALDIGCGAGILTEPLARMGFKTTGADLSAPNIEIAKHRNHEQNLGIEYACCEASTFIPQGRQFDIVCALEVIEHVEDQAGFVRMCAELTKPGGLVFFSTLNKTLKSYLLAILGAEYVLRLLPIGTHDHSLFVSPDTLEGWMTDSTVTPLKRMGMHYNPLFSSWKTSDDVSVNYILVGKKG